MKKHLLVQGDLRIGDCFHMGTYLNSIKNEYQTTWIHGPYERHAVKLMRDYMDLGIDLTIEKPSLCLPNIPADFTSVRKFNDSIDIKEFEYDLLTTHEEAAYPGKNNIVYKTKNLPKLDIYGKYIVVHTSTVSRFKQIKCLYDIIPDVPMYGVGYTTELIPTYALDFRGKPLEYVATLLLNASCFIGIHSSMACLAFHLGTPMITCYFGKGEMQLVFSEYRDKCIDVIDATPEKIYKSIQTLIN